LKTHVESRDSWKEDFLERQGADCRILGDGREAARMANDSTTPIPFEQGSHAIRLRIDRCELKELRTEARHGESVPLQCGPNTTPLPALLHVILKSKNDIWLRNTVGSDS
jgi:hypothetical protein